MATSFVGIGLPAAPRQRLASSHDCLVAQRPSAARPIRQQAQAPFEVVSRASSSGEPSASREFVVTRREAFFAALSASLAAASPSAALAAISKSDTAFTVTDKIPGPPAIQYTFSFPLTWKKKIVQPARSSGTYCFWDVPTKDVAALAVDAVKPASVAEAGKPEDFIKSIAKTLLDPPIEESDEDPDVLFS
eukprot:tig00020660_g12525.t1